MPALATGAVFLVLAAFLASTVEMVEALTIVLAVGVSRQWRSTLIGVGVALVALAAVVAALGPASALIPIDAVRVLVGALLLIFGLQWLRKAILRASGHVALHDEEAIYQRELAAFRTTQGGNLSSMDWYSFTLAFKGVFLEGLEVVFIVLTFGANAHDVPLAAVARIVAVVPVVLLALALKAPLASGTENAMNFVVGVMLTSFCIFWGAEGADAHWPGS